MWISKAKWTAMVERLDAVERRAAADRDRIRGIFPQGPDGHPIFNYPEMKSVPVHEAIYHILDHLGLRFAREPETPAHFKLLPRASKKTK